MAGGSQKYSTYQSNIKSMIKSSEESCRRIRNCVFKFILNFRKVFVKANCETLLRKNEQFVKLKENDVSFILRAAMQHLIDW